MASAGMEYATYKRSIDAGQKECKKQLGRGNTVDPRSSPTTSRVQICGKCFCCRVSIEIIVSDAVTGRATWGLGGATVFKGSCQDYNNSQEETRALVGPVSGSISNSRPELTASFDILHINDL